MLDPLETLRLGRALRRYLASERAYTLLDASSLRGSTWTAGGCWALAQALHHLLDGSRLVALVDASGVHQHVLVQLGDFYLDADGASTELAVERRWARRERLRLPKIRAFSRVQAERGGIRCPSRLVVTLRDALATELPWRLIQLDPPL
jgi:hypothetical protein